MPTTFERWGIQFQYPDNWALEEESAQECQSVTVTSPGGAFWSVSRHSLMTDPTMLIRAAAEALREEYKQLEIEEVDETVAGIELLGSDFSFFCLDFIGSARVRSFCTDQATYSIFCQAEDRELGRLTDVFQAMTVDFLKNFEAETPET